MVCFISVLGPGLLYLRCGAWYVLSPFWGQVSVISFVGSGLLYLRVGAWAALSPFWGQVCFVSVSGLVSCIHVFGAWSALSPLCSLLCCISVVGGLVFGRRLACCLCFWCMVCFLGVCFCFWCIVCFVYLLGVGWPVLSLFWGSGLQFHWYYFIRPHAHSSHFSYFFTTCHIPFLHSHTSHQHPPGHSASLLPPASSSSEAPSPLHAACINFISSSFGSNARGMTQFAPRWCISDSRRMRV